MRLRRDEAPFWSNAGSEVAAQLVDDDEQVGAPRVVVDGAVAPEAVESRRDRRSTAARGVAVEEPRG